MFSLLRRRHATTTIHVHLGRTDLVAFRDELARHLRRTRDQVTVEIVGFDYFDANDLDELNAVVEAGHGRVNVAGLDGYAEAIASVGEHESIDIRDRAERAVTLLGAVAVITVVVDG